ncbi:lycopene cyclase domain-containing protein [Flavihumibacter sp. R14]|nr:lycopene cyclase domain-containing protein [Flavihumibacter soli]
MTKFTYLLVNLGTILIPFLFSFHPKLKFYKTWKSFFPGLGITGFIFIVWDVYFTYLGVWGFNKNYLTGVEVLNLPVEEILFFFCIPYACVFTYHCLDILIKKSPVSAESTLTLLLIIILITTGILFYNKLYSVFTFISLAVVLALAKYILKVTWLSKFYLIYAILLIPFLIVNGILTGSGLEHPVVWYNEMETIGIRIGTIPLEDVFYGMELILINLLIYKNLLKRQRSKKIKESLYT